ncbi:hypothetical protein DFH08DRAFT_905750 [Mycena albidolilacea]|uniref:Uncharacterized protein n=1 Tax=Mycena albidolilacea TaxID=1033008 RepID=A0AAD6YZR8_9AGAR|nr:hypothetical protein DFH08DRAFT_905750 [Mycena albidolilacea]
MVCDSLPQELLDTILDNLHDDYPSLKSCALAARTFVASARIHAFRRVEILPPKDPLSSPNPCQRFHELLTSSPHIASLVQELTIVLVNSETNYDLEGDSLDDRRVPWVMADQTLSLVLPQLDLKRISITEDLQRRWNPGGRYSMNWDSMDRRLRSALMNKFSSPRLEAVHLRGIVVESPRQLLSFFSEAASLKEISLSRFFFSKPDNEHEAWPELQLWRPQLRSLLVYDFQNREFCRYLVNPQIDLTAVKSLSLAVYWTEAGWRERLIQATSAGVEHLRYWSMSATDCNPEIFCPNLRSVHIFSYSIFEFLCIFFKSYPYDTHLECITLEGHGDTPVSGPAELEAVIGPTVARFRSLKLVEIRSTLKRSFAQFAEWAAAVRAALPSLEGRGLLRVTEAPWPHNEAHHWE